MTTNPAPDNQSHLLEACLQSCVVHPSHMLTLLTDAMPPAYPPLDNSTEMALIHTADWEQAASQLWDLCGEPLPALFLNSHGIQPVLLATLDGATAALENTPQSHTSPTYTPECMGALHRRIELACGTLANLAATLPGGGADIDQRVVALIREDVLGGGQGPPRVADAAALTEAVRLCATVARQELSMKSCMSMKNMKSCMSVKDGGHGGDDGGHGDDGGGHGGDDGGQTLSIKRSGQVVDNDEQEVVCVEDVWSGLIHAPWLPPLLLWIADNTLHDTLYQQSMQLLSTCCMLHPTIVAPLLQQPATATVLHDALHAFATSVRSNVCSNSTATTPATRDTAATPSYQMQSNVAHHDDTVPTTHHDDTVPTVEEKACENEKACEKALAAFDLLQTILCVDQRGPSGGGQGGGGGISNWRDTQEETPLQGDNTYEIHGLSGLLVQACPWLPEVCIQLGLHNDRLDKHDRLDRHADEDPHCPAASVARAARAMIAALHSVCIPLLLSTVHSTHAMLVLRTLIIHNVRMLRDAAHDDDDDDDKGPEGCSSWLVEDVRACLSIAHGVLYYGGDAAIGMLSRDNVLLEYVEEAAQEAALHDAARGVARALTKAK